MQVTAINYHESRPVNRPVNENLLYDGEMTSGEGGTWEERMADRARRRAELNTPQEGPVDQEALLADQPWLHGWPRLQGGRQVLIGTGVHCVCCGRCSGITTVAFPSDWEPPGPDPDWPFGESDCPLCAPR